MVKEEVFKEIYINNSWGSKESKSGGGSELKNNIKLLYKLKELVENNNIKSIVDLGCGDFNWMKEFDFSLIDSYHGFDIVKQLIDDNNNKYSHKFSIMDITQEIPPKADLVICKDILFHLSYEDALKAISNIYSSGSKYLLTTTFVDSENKDIVTGGWRPINLETEPFLLKGVVDTWYNIEERDDIHKNKSLLLIDLRCRNE